MRSPALLAACCASSALLVAATLAAPPAPSAVKLLYPLAGTVRKPGPVRVLLAAPKGAPMPSAAWDGKPLRLSRMAFDPAWTAPTPLQRTSDLLGDRSAMDLWLAAPVEAAGKHTLQAAGRSLALTVNAAAAKGLALAVAHPKPASATCSGCHTVTQGLLGDAGTPGACAGCHDDAAVQTIHKHVTEPLRRCAMCHDPHEAARPNLLCATKEKLCSRCHALGHSKG